MSRRKIPFLFLVNHPTVDVSHFHVLTGYPPDLVHDLLEGIVPYELVHCLEALISKGHFDLNTLNKSIENFPFKWTDNTNSPKCIPPRFSLKQTIGGNAHENWALIRMLPFLTGHRVPVGEPAWEILMDLKEIVELSVSSFHTDKTIAYLDSKISDHRQKVRRVFPDVRLIPKHHLIR